MESPKAFVDPEEDEVFFGPVTDREKELAAKYKNRRTMLLPSIVRDSDPVSSTPAQDRRKHVHTLTPYQRPSVSKLSISELSHCSISEEHGVGDASTYSVFGTPSKREMSFRKCNLTFETLNESQEHEAVVTVEEKINQLSIKTLPEIDIELSEVDDSHVSSCAEALPVEEEVKKEILESEVQHFDIKTMENEHNYSTPVKMVEKIDKNVLKTPKSIFQAGEDGGYLSVLSEIAIVKAEEEKDIPDIVVTEPSPYKEVETPSPVKVALPTHKFRLVYNTPGKTEEVKKDEEDIISVKSTSDIEVKNSGYESCNEIPSPSKVTEEEEDCFHDMSVDLFKAAELESEVNKLVKSFRSGVTDDLDFSITDSEVNFLMSRNSFITAEDVKILDDSFLDADQSLKQQETKQTFLTPSQKQLLASIVSNEKRTMPTTPEDKKFTAQTPVKSAGKPSFRLTPGAKPLTAKNAPNTSAAKQTPSSVTSAAKQTPSSVTSATKQTPSSVSAKKQTPNFMTAKKQTPSSSATKQTPKYVTASKQTPRTMESPRETISSALKTKETSCARKLLTDSTSKTNIASTKKQDTFKQPCLSKIPKFGSVSKPGVKKLGPVSTPTAQMLFSEVESPVHAYINHKPVPLIQNVKDRRVQGKVKTASELEDSMKKLWETKISKDCEENRDPNIAVGAPALPAVRAPALPYAEYHTAKPVVMEKPSESKLPRLAPTMRKLIPEKSPKVIKHEGRVLSRSTNQHEVSVLLSQNARNTRIFK